MVPKQKLERAVPEEVRRFDVIGFPNVNNVV
jgi:hypothetical protein